MTKHPECGDDEVFVGNADDNTIRTMGWKTKRRGKIAYKKNGERITIEWRGAFPVFVQKSEIAEKDPKLLEWIERGRKD